MKKGTFWWIGLAVVAAVLFGYAGFAAVYYDGFFTNVLVKGHLYQKGTGSQSGVTAEGLSTLLDARITEDIEYIDDDGDLSTLSGAASGSSYFQAEPSRVYLVDPYAILRGVAGTPVGSTTGFQNFTGVSVFLPSAHDSARDGMVVGVGMEVTGTTGFPHLQSGATPIWVWPYPGTGATTYGTNTSKPETLVTVYGINGTIATYTMGSGVSYWEIDRPGEIAYFRLNYNSQVSAVPVKRQVFN